MTRALPRFGFSALYGAFGVILVSAIIIGTVLAAMGGAPPSPDRERALARAFLETALRANVDGRTTLQDAVALSCFAAPCANGTWSPSALAAAVDRVAGPLGSALERSYLVAFTVDGSTPLRVGPAPAGAAGGIAVADVFRPASADFVGVTLRLAPL
jgi:hypothetical protein